MIHTVRQIRQELNGLLDKICATGKQGVIIDVDEAIAETAKIILDASSAGGKLIFIGNGGSAAIASHMAVDFWKNAKVKAIAFNDASLLTCLSNDFGYEHVFEKSIDMFGYTEDILIAISSSGESANILNGARIAKKKGMVVITLSGFKEDNSLRSLGYINFYVPSIDYGHVEVIHHYLCHCFVNIILKKTDTFLSCTNQPG